LRYAGAQLSESFVRRAAVAGRRQFRAQALRALDLLPASFREVLLLADVEEFTYKETAELLHIPLGTVMSRLRRARKLLRDALSIVAVSYGVTRAAHDNFERAHLICQ
jgi:RNA polymerase sigma factor (sigma-70 family)